MKKLRFWLATIAVLLCSVSVSAHDFEVDGIYYNITSETDLTVEVTYKGEERASYSNEYTGVLAIPESVTYNGKNYSVTGIGTNAFYECPGLTNITYPKSVKSIGNSAFRGCSGLTSITIPNSMTNIGNYMFYGCSSLTSITIPNSVTSIGTKAFRDCSGLQKIAIGNSVTSIGDEAFYRCKSLKTVINCSDLDIWTGSESYGYVAYYASEVQTVYDGGCIGDYIFYKNNNDRYVLISYMGNSKELILPESYEGEDYEIGDGAFYNYSSLTSVTIPNSVTTIRDYAFSDCTSLKKMIIEDGSTPILSSEYGFENCPLEYVYIGREFLGIPNFGITLKTAVFGSQVRTINALFAECSGLTSITIPNSVTSIGTEAFKGCTGLTSITIPNSVTSIGDYAFCDCTGLTSITIPNSVTGIGRYAFSACTGLTNITIGNSVQNIEYGAFYNCTGLTSITIPNSVISIGSYKEGYNTTSAFSGCNQLTKLIIEDGSTYIDLGYSQFIDCPLEYVYIGRNHSYTNKPFNGEDYTLGTAVIGPKVRKIENYLFKDCWGLWSVTIPDSVTSIGNYTFSGCRYLKSITIPNSVTSIGEGAFYNCTGLTSINIPNSVTSIGNYAFEDCYNLTSITIPNSVTSIGAYTFNNCSFTSVTIPNSVTSIGKEAFSYSDLTSITIGNSVTSIGDNAFSGCSKLKTVINFSNLAISKGSKSNGYVGYYANKVINADEQIGNFFFKTTKNVHSLNGYLGDEGNLELPQDYKGNKYSIGESVFSGCRYLKSITIPNSVTSIGEGAFYNCTGLTSINIPNSVTSIGASAFSGCKGIKELIIEDGSTYIDLGYSQFIDCPLEYVYIGRNHSYTNNPFKEGNTLKTVVIGPNVTRIGNYLFDYCKGLKSVTIPNSVTIIGEWAFRGCSGLTSVTIPNSVTSIGEYAFYSCSGLTNVTIPNSVTSIGNSVFEGCSSLKDLYIGSSMTSIGDNLLTGCTNLNTLSVGAKIPPTVNDLGLGSQQYFTVKLQVPEGSKAMYQFAEAWKKFFNIEEFDPATGIAEVTPDAEEKNLPIYNLQGTRMTEDKENLPTGIYIQGGKKIFIK